MIHDTTINLYHTLCAPEICGRDIIDGSLLHDMTIGLLFDPKSPYKGNMGASRRIVTTFVLMFMLHGELYA
jgi:hypothetical protein